MLALIKKIGFKVWDLKYWILSTFLVTVIAMGYSKNFDSFYWRFILVVFVLSCIPLFFLRRKIEWFCFSIIVLFGSYFVIVSPVFDVLDEPAHYARTQYISEGNFTLSNDNSKLEFSKDYQFLTKMMGYDGMKRLNPKKNFFHTNLFAQQHNPEKEVETKIKATRNYGTIMYLPSAFGIWLGKIVSKGNLGVMFYLGRFMNLLSYALMAYFAIKISGRWKALVGFFSIQHLPIYIASSFSQDAFFYGLSLLIVAKFIQLFDREDKINWMDIIQVTVFSVLMVFSKLPNIVLIGLLVYIPYKRYKNLRTYLLVFLSIVIVILIGLLWVKHYNMIEVTDLPKSVDQTRQLAFIRENPFKFISYLMMGTMNTILKYRQYYSFGWSFKYSEVAHMFSLLLMGAVLFVYPQKLHVTVNKMFKVGVLGVSLFVLLVTNFIMYISFTGVGETVISGVQGRYFFGILLFAPFLTNIPNQIIGYSGINNHLVEEKFDQVILGISFLLLVWMAAIRIGIYY